MLDSFDQELIEMTLNFQDLFQENNRAERKSFFQSILSELKQKLQNQNISDSDINEVLATLLINCNMTLDDVQELTNVHGDDFEFCKKEADRVKQQLVQYQKQNIKEEN
jgi:hypothetical protein